MLNKKSDSLKKSLESCISARTVIITWIDLHIGDDCQTIASFLKMNRQGEKISKTKKKLNQRSS